MQANEHQQWRISVKAKSKPFRFKFRAKNLVPTWNFRRISISFNLKIPKILNLRVKTESKPITRTHRPSRTFKSKLISIFKKFRAPRTRAGLISNTQIPKTKQFGKEQKQIAYQEPIANYSLVVGIVVFLSRLVSGNKQIKFAFCCAVSVFCSVLLIKNRKFKSSLRVVCAMTLALILVCLTVFDLGECFKYHKIFDSEYLDFLCGVLKVIFSWFCQSLWW